MTLPGRIRRTRASGADKEQREMFKKYAIGIHLLPGVSALSFFP
jgi:hypothetical protein